MAAGTDEVDSSALPMPRLHRRRHSQTIIVFATALRPLTMSIAHLAQPGILEPIPTHARYLSCQLRVGADPCTALRRLASQADGRATVVGVGHSLAMAMGRSVPGLATFRGIDNAKVKLPSTPIDLLLWLRGRDRGELLFESRHLQTLLAPAFDVIHITDAINHNNSRDLTGYEDGTENPKGDDAIEAALVSSGGDEMVGSSFLAAMRWHHHLNRFEAMPRHQQDNTFGRYRDSNEEIDDAPASAHTKRTAQEEFDPPSFVVRRSMPWVQDNEGGLVFAAFARDFGPFERQLTRMSGAEDGIVDALFTFSEPLACAYFWCPPTKDGLVNLQAIGI